MGIVTTTYFLLKGLYYRAVGWVWSLFGKERPADHGPEPLVLYSEGRQYVSSFQPLLAELERRKRACLFLTSDPEDPCVQLAIATIATKCIGSGHAAWRHLNFMAADVCLMTTPRLDVLQIKRSKRVAHYCHFIHSPTDKAFNRAFSFDYFDSVLISGEHHVRTLRTLESIRKEIVRALGASEEQRQRCPPDIDRRGKQNDRGQEEPPTCHRQWRHCRQQNLPRDERGAHEEGRGHQDDEVLGTFAACRLKIARLGHFRTPQWPAWHGVA